MYQIDSNTDIDIRVAEHILVIEPKPANPDSEKLFTTTFLFQSIGRIFILAVIRLRGGLGHLWAIYLQRVLVFGEQEEGGIIMPRSALTFIINALLALVEIKSQGETGFPFQTHHRSMMFSVSSLLIYGLASGAEHVISIVGIDNTSVYAVIARLGRLGALCILVASLSSLFYF